MANNFLSKNIKINHYLLNIRQTKFILFGSTDNKVYCNSDYYKSVDYVIDIDDINYKNDLDTTIANISIKKDHIYSGCIYNIFNNRQQNSTL